MSLLRADRLFIVLPAPDGFSLHFSDPEMAGAAAEYQAYFHSLDVWTGARRRVLGLNVYSHDMLLRGGDERSEFWNDYILRHRLYQPAGLSCEVADCPVPASLIGYKSGPQARRFGDRELAILNVLQPLFASTVRAITQFHTAARELASTIDRTPVPAFLVGKSGMLHVNSEFARTFGTMAASVSGTVVPVVVKFLNEGKGANAAGAVPLPDGRSVSWSVSLLSHIGPGPIALVHFHVPHVLHMSDRTREELGLTPRQATVAMLMAEGRTYREIATALGIRPHTARRHWEQVLQRLGVRFKSEVRHRLSSREL